MKRSTLQHNLKICMFNLWENDEKIKWISDLICMKHLVSCLATVILTRTLDMYSTVNKITPVTGTRHDLFVFQKFDLPYTCTLIIV